MKLRISIICAGLLCALPPTFAANEQQATLSKNYQVVDANKPVLCLLPGRVRKLGSTMTYLERRKPSELTASECEIRGGEYTLYDRANYETALAVWMEDAKQGDNTAQIYVGEIYEKGWLGQPDFKQAGYWYGLAAKDGDRRAQRRMAYLYESGLGVEQDTKQALSLWRSALNLDEDLVLASELEAAKSSAQRQIDELLATLERQNLNTGRLQRSLQESRATLVAQGEQIIRERLATAALQRELKDSRSGATDTARVRELEQEIANREGQLDEQQLAMELLEARVSAQQAQVAASVRQGEVREKQLVNARNALEAEALRGDSLLQELNTQGQQLKGLEQQLAQANAQLSANQRQQATLNQQLQSSAGADQAGLRAQLAAAQSEAAKGKARISELQQLVARERSGFNDELASASLREADLGAALAASKAEKEKLAASLKVAQSRAGNLEEELTTSRYALADARAAAATLNENIAELGAADTGKLQQLSTRLAAQEQNIKQLSQERDTLQTRWQEVVSERDQIRRTLASEVDRRSWLEIEYEALKTRLATAQSDLRNLDQEMQQVRFEKRQLSSNVERLEQDLSRSRARGESDRRELEQELKRAQTLVAGTDSELSTLREKRERLASDVDLWEDRQETQVLAMRGLTAAPVLATSPSNVKREGNYRAIIIANYDYDDLPTLASPSFDARQLKQLLESRYGFDVEVKLNLNRTEMFKVLNSVRKADPKDFVLLYYAGHGKMDEYGDGYWLPTDFREDDPMSDAISSGDLTQTLNQSSARHVLVVADSCYSGALARNTSPTIKKSVPALMKYWMNNKSRTVLTSGGLKPVLDAGPGDNSVFAGALLRVLTENGEAINGELLYAKIHDIVREEAARLGYLDQVPQFAAIEDAGHENGQFVFIPQG